MLDYCTIPLTKGKIALVDLEDYPRVCNVAWQAHQHNRVKHLWYASRSAQSNNVQRYVAMHRFLMNAPPGVDVDHINGDGLDNRRANLRLATAKQNCANQRKPITRPSGYSSRFKGVTWKKREATWVAQIKVNYRNRWLGYFALEEDAARAYNAAALSEWGEFALLNILPPIVQEAGQLTLC